MSKEKLFTAAVVFLGIVALAVAGKYHADPEWIATGASILVLVAGSLRSMLLKDGGGNGTGPAAVVLLACALGMGSTGCAFLRDKGPDIADLFFRKVQCALVHQNLPDEEIVERCAIEPGDVERVMEIVGESRTEAATEAEAARADERERIGAAAPACAADAGPSDASAE